MAGKMTLRVSSSSLALAAAISITLLLRLASAQSPPSTSGCTAVIIGLAPCLGYISGNASAPSSSCCSQLSGVVNNQPQCLCVLLNGGASSFGLSINQTRALALPAACKLSTPPVSLCNAVSGPTASPATPAATPSVPSGSGGAGAPETPSTPSSTPPPPSSSTVPSSGGSKSTPSTGNGGESTSDGISSSGSTSLLLIISAFMVAASTFFIQLPFY